MSQTVLKNILFRFVKVNWFGRTGSKFCGSRFTQLVVALDSPGCLEPGVKTTLPPQVLYQYDSKEHIPNYSKFSNGKNPHGLDKNVMGYFCWDTCYSLNCLFLKLI